jgi:DNA-binding cell septation regulator SpoVG
LIGLAYLQKLRVFEEIEERKGEREKMSDITKSMKVHMYKRDEGKKIVATANVIIDSAITINDIAIKKNKDGGLYVSMPQQKYEKDGEMVYNDFAFPLGKGARERFNEFILHEYEYVKERESSVSAKVYKTSNQDRILANADITVKTSSGNEVAIRGFMLARSDSANTRVYWPQTSYEKDGERRYRDVVESAEKGLRAKVESAIKEEYEKLTTKEQNSEASKNFKRDNYQQMDSDPLVYEPCPEKTPISSEKKTKAQDIER